MSDTNLHPDILSDIAKSEADGGIWLKDIALGKGLRVQTRNTLYELDHREDGWYIRGHAKYCPEWTQVQVNGSTFGGSMLKMGFLGLDMYMEFHVAGYSAAVTTSRIQDIQEVS